jgi:hypothetical protein
MTVEQICLNHPDLTPSQVKSMINVLAQSNDIYEYEDGKWKAV